MELGMLTEDLGQKETKQGNKMLSLPVIIENSKLLTDFIKQK